jgi:hypothetical protein
MESIVIVIGLALVGFSLLAIARYDWMRLTRRSCRATGHVTGHRITRDGDGSHFSAIYSFQTEAGLHSVEDAVQRLTPEPPVGTTRKLTYPEGHPNLARPPRALLWLAVNSCLVGLACILVAKAAGILGP